MRATWIVVLLLALFTASTALAKPKKHRGKKAQVEEPAPEPEPEPEPEPLPEEPPPEAFDNGENGEGADNAAAVDAASEADEGDAAPTGKPTWWVGAYLDGVWVPGFMLSLFLENPPTVGNAAFGAQVTHRSEDGFSWVLGLGYAGYSFEGPLQKTGDPDVDTEWVTSSLGLVHVSGTLLWSTELSEMFSFEYGIGVDLGIVTGDLERSEAYRVSPNGRYAPCVGPLNPPVTSGLDYYCEQPTRNGIPIAGSNTYDEYGAHYGVKEERVPPVALMPALPQLALRFSPHRNVAVKLEAAYGVFQFRFGLSAAYGLDL